MNKFILRSFDALDLLGVWLGLLSLRVDPLSGRAASPGSPDAYFELFKSEDSPPPMSELDPALGIPGSPLPADEATPIDLF
jgi:penicillin-binding protein 1A